MSDILHTVRRIEYQNMAINYFYQAIQVNFYLLLGIHAPRC